MVRKIGKKESSEILRTKQIVFSALQTTRNSATDLSNRNNNAQRYKTIIVLQPCSIYGVFCNFLILWTEPSCERKARILNSIFFLGRKRVSRFMRGFATSQVSHFFLGRRKKVKFPV